MKVEVLTIGDCPSRALAVRRVRDALVRLGRADVEIQEREILDAAAAVESGLRGSPTILVDGRDLLEEPGSEPSWSCRLYLSDEGPLAGAPSLERLTEGLAAYLAIGSAC